MREDLQDRHVIIGTGDAGTFTQTTAATPALRVVLAALSVAAPRSDPPPGPRGHDDE